MVENPGRGKITGIVVDSVHARDDNRIQDGTKAAVYLDYAATTPVDSRVVSAMSECLGIDGIFGNAASHLHCFGQEAEAAVEKARKQVAALISADPSEIIWGGVNKTV